MIAVLALMISLGQAPPDREALVLLARRTGDPSLAERITGEVRQVLAAAGIRAPLAPDDLGRRLGTLGIKDATGCAGKKACVLELGRKLQLEYLVSLSVAAVEADVSLHLEALKVSTGERLAQDTILVDAADPKGVSAAVAPFARALRAAIPPRVADAPTQPLLVPPPAPDAPPVALAPEARSRAPALILGGGAVVVLGLAATLGALGLAAKGRVDQRGELNGLPTSTLSRSDSVATAGAANAQLTGALISAVAGVALAGGAGAYWAASAPAQPDSGH